MIVPLINVSSFLDVNLFTISELKQATQSSVELVTREVYRKIIELAKDELKSTRQTYIQNLNVSIGELSGIVKITDALPLMIENGITPFDMKVGFANSQKAKRKGANLEKFNKGGKIEPSEEGWYLTIPLRKGTPGTLSENFAGVMDKNIYNVVKKNKPIYTSTNTPTGKGLSISQLKQIGSQYAEKLTRPAVGEFGSYTHKSPIFQGLGRVEKQYSKATQSQYMTFRRVSSNSDPNSWIHKGFIAKHFFERALQEVDIDGLTQVAIIDFLGEL